MKNILRIKGFTLVEMVLYVSLCSIILLALSTFLSELLSSRVRSQSIAEVNQQGNQVMYMITRTIRNGRSITSPSMGTASSSLYLVTGDASLNPTIFNVSSSTFYVQEGVNKAVPITNSRVAISNVIFENVSSSSSTEKIMRVSFNVNYINLNGKSEFTYSKSFKGSATLR